MRQAGLLIYISFISITSFAQVYKGQVEFAKIPVPAQHYQEEYTFDTTVNMAVWTTQAKKLHLSFAPTDESYFRSEVPELKNETLSWEGVAWRGERLNTEILAWSPDTINQVRFILSDLKNEKGNVLSKNIVQLNMVRYVIGNYPYGAKNVTCGVSPYPNLYLMPDRFESFDRFDIPGKTVRPVWLSFDIPAATIAGTYSGTIEVLSENSSTKLNLKVHVQNQMLPKPHEWKHRLDLWQNPWVVAWKNNLKPWSEEHKMLLKKHLQLYADAGGKYITTYAVNSPWSDNSYMNEGGMIDWIKRTDGSWKFNYNIFDQYVQLAGYRFNYIDERTGNNMIVSWAPGSKEFKNSWNVFLTDLKKHLEQKGWFEKTYIGINENAPDETLAAINVVKQNSKKWKITYAGDWHKELDSLLDDYCFLIGKESDVNVVKQRRARGLTTTYYNCCNPPVPNNFVFSPPVEGRWLGWYTSAHKYDGYLRWAYDAWPADPMRDARHELWPAGDCYLVYPGGTSCVRFEKIREGIVDYEKIRIVREKALKSTDKSVKYLIQQLDMHLETLLSEKDFDTKKITVDVNKGKKIIEQLSEKLK